MDATHLKRQTGHDRIGVVELENIDILVCNTSLPQGLKIEKKGGWKKKRKKKSVDKIRLLY